MFERITATKWKLTDEGKQQIGSLLVYMRNEFRAGVSAVSYDVPNPQSNAIEGSAVNYKKMMQCIDRILSRLDGTWDAHKLANCYGMIARAFDNAKDGRLAKHIINEAENMYGALAPNSVWNRIDGEGDDKLPGKARQAIDGPIDGG